MTFASAHGSIAGPYQGMPPVTTETFRLKTTLDVYAGGVYHLDLSKTETDWATVDIHRSATTARYGISVLCLETALAATQSAAAGSTITLWSRFMLRGMAGPTVGTGPASLEDVDADDGVYVAANAAGTATALGFGAALCPTNLSEVLKTSGDAAAGVTTAATPNAKVVALLLQERTDIAQHEGPMVLSGDAPDVGAAGNQVAFWGNVPPRCRVLFDGVQGFGRGV